MKRYYERILLEAPLCESQTLQKFLMMNMFASFNQLAFKVELQKKNDEL